MLPHSLGRDAASSSSSSSSSQQKHRSLSHTLRHLLLTSIPPSPFTAIACPSMLLFLCAFYLLHVAFVMFGSHAESLKKCEELIVYAWNVMWITGLLIAVHLTLIVPNALEKKRREMKEGLQRSSATLPTSSRPSSSRCTSSRLRYAFVLLTYYLVSLLQQLTWLTLLIYHLYENLLTYWRIDVMMDALKEREKMVATSNAGVALLAESSDLCGSSSSIHLVRWSLLAIVVTTAVALSLLIMWAQNGVNVIFQCIRKSRSSGKVTSLEQQKLRAQQRSTTSPTQSSLASDWLDLQGDDEGKRTDWLEEDEPLKRDLR